MRFITTLEWTRSPTRHAVVPLRFTMLDPCASSDACGRTPNQNNPKARGWKYSERSSEQRFVCTVLWCTGVETANLPEEYFVFRRQVFKQSPLHGRNRHPRMVFSGAVMLAESLSLRSPFTTPSPAQ